MYKKVIISLLVILLATLFLYYFNSKINYLNNKNSELLQEFELYKSKVDFNLEINSIRAIVVPITSTTISIKDTFCADISLSAFNNKGPAPIVIIGDSIDENNNLINRLDTFTTNQYLTSITRKFKKKGENKIYGKYITKALNGKDISLDFIINVTIQ